MSGHVVLSRRMSFVYAIIAALSGLVQSRAVNISNTWTLPEEGFPVFYRHFRDRISWYEADAVCQFHHANLVTADTSSQYDAIRAYLKELDIREKIWIGLSKSRENPAFTWTDFRALSGNGHWQESFPIGDGQSLCAVMDPVSDFLWRALPCGGPEVAAFICELPIPSWASGPKGCLLTELPSLTVLYIPEQSALELTSDCGLDGTKRIACKGNADREDMLRRLSCAISNDVMDDEKSSSSKVATFADYSSESSPSTTEDNNVMKGWTSNTVNGDYGTPTRHRRETEDTLISPTSTKSSFRAKLPSDISWRDTHQEKTVLTTQGSTIAKTPTETTMTVNTATPKTDDNSPSTEKEGESVTILSTSTTNHPTIAQLSKNLAENDGSNETNTTSTVKELTVDDYPSAINQGQLFSIIENGTMFDIIELNDTDPDLQTTKATSINPTAIPSKKPTTKKPTIPTKSPTKDLKFKKQSSSSDREKSTTATTISTTTIITSTTTTTTEQRPKSVDEMEENLTKEFEMMPDIKDASSPKLNRTFRKEAPPPPPSPPIQDATKMQAKNVNISKNIDKDSSSDNIDHRTRGEGEKTTVGHPTTTAIKEINETKIDDVAKTTEEAKTTFPPSHVAIDPRLYVLNNRHANVELNDDTNIASHPIPNDDHHEITEDGGHPNDNNRPNPTDEPKKMNRRKILHNQTKGKKFYPYFFSRMLG